MTSQTVPKIYSRTEKRGMKLGQGQLAAAAAAAAAAEGLLLEASAFPPLPPL
jgi:hypothetical protein